MNTAEFVRIINEDFQIGWPFRDWGLSLTARLDTAFAAVRIRAVGVVPHRDTGESGCSIHAERMVSVQHIENVSVETCLDFARDLLRKWLLHEIDESILVKGKRVFDPHATSGG